MMTPSLFHDNFDLFDQFYQNPWFGFDDREFKKMEKQLYGHRAKNVMSTDIKENDTDNVILNKLKELGTKLTGQENVQGETVSEVLDFINNSKDC